MTFDMNITCTNCRKESVVTLEYDPDSMSAKITEDITGTCTKKGGRK